MPENISYRSSELARYFQTQRMRWDQFYPSEQWVLDRVGRDGAISRVLDVGCAAGGLGLALQERFELKAYVGVEINEQVLAVARARQAAYRCGVEFRLGDILNIGEIAGGPFDLVANLSCSDWNIRTNAITEACWRHVAPGGAMVISLRLTDGPSLNDFARSYQFIRYDGDTQPGDERANYVVFNVRDAMRLFEELRPRPSQVLGYGYWGRPSKTAVTPHEQLVFSVFAITKPTAECPTFSELHLPLSLWTGSRTSDGTV